MPWRERYVGTAYRAGPSVGLHLVLGCSWAHEEVAPGNIGAMPARRRRTALFAVAWVVAAAASVLVASQGVALVGRQVTDRRPSPLSAAQIEDALADAEQTSTSTSRPLDATSPTTPSSSSSSTSTTSTTVTGDSTPPPAPGPGPATSTTTIRSTSTTAPPAAPDAETRTYSVEGGTVSLRFASTGVTVVFANPAAGFDVEVEPEHGNGVGVEFESETHRSRVDGWWEGGPVDRVREEER